MRPPLRIVRQQNGDHSFSRMSVRLVVQTATQLRHWERFDGSTDSLRDFVPISSLGIVGWPGRFLNRRFIYEWRDFIGRCVDVIWFLRVFFFFLRKKKTKIGRE